DSVGSRARVELGQEADQVRFLARLTDEQGAQPAVQLGVEVLRTQLRQDRNERAMGGDTRKRVSFQPLAGIEQARRDLARRASRTARRETRLRLLRQIQLVGDETQSLLALRRILEPSENLAHADEAFLPARRSVELEANAVEEIARRGYDALLETVREIGWIQTTRQCDDANVETLCRGELHAPQRRRLARSISVETKDGLLGQPGELTQLSFGQRRSHGGDDRLDASLTQGEHVSVPFDDDRALLLGDRVSRMGEAVEEIPFAEELALG